MIGLDFGTTNSAIAVARGEESPILASFPTAAGPVETFRSILFFDEERRGPRRRPLPWAGPGAIEAYLEAGGGGRLIQSTKSYLASRVFDKTLIFGHAFTLADLIAGLVGSLRQAAEADLGRLDGKVVVGRPVRFVRGDADEDDRYAQGRLEAALYTAGFKEVIFEFEPVAAAYHYERGLRRDERLLIADFGGGTSDFCVIEVGPSRRACPDPRSGILGTSGVGVAGDAFDARFVRNVVAPELGLGSLYRPLAQELEIPHWIYSRLERWHHLSFLRSRETMEALREIERSALEPDKIAALIHLIDYDLGFHLYRAVEATKVALSSTAEATFVFEEPTFTIEKRVRRSDFEAWIRPELTAIAGCVDGLLADLGLRRGQIDQVFMTGGSSFVPAVRRLFEERFGADRISAGGELTSVASGLALRAQEITGG